MPAGRLIDNQLGGEAQEKIKHLVTLLGHLKANLSSCPQLVRKNPHNSKNKTKPFFRCEKQGLLRFWLRTA